RARRRRGRDGRPGGQLEVEERRDDPEPGPEVEPERMRVEALVHEPDLRDAAAGELDRALEEPAADAAALDARVDGDRPDRRHRPARMDPRDADDLAVLLR